MPIPDYQSIMDPLIRFLGDGKLRVLEEVINEMAKVFNVTAEERQALLPSGAQRIFDNRVGWARTYLRKAGVIEIPKRGLTHITQRGLGLLKQNPEVINNKTLSQYPEFCRFARMIHEKEQPSPTPGNQHDSHAHGAVPNIQSQKSPEEEFETAFQSLQRETQDELLEMVKSCSPNFFEKLVVDLMLAMGYGGSRKEAGQAVGGTGDEGIDGIIQEDRLGLDNIYLQAKRWNNPVGRPEVQKFVGALEGKQATKGVLITTSYFQPTAIEYAKKISNKKVKLIDGQRLVEHMIEYNVGVSTAQIFKIKKIDSDYFDE